MNINQMLTDLNQVKTTTELIGDYWVVAADDVRQFAALVPEIVLPQSMQQMEL